MENTKGLNLKIPNCNNQTKNAIIYQNWYLQMKLATYGIEKQFYVLEIYLAGDTKGFKEI